jgi:hypothetical protein
MDAQAIAAVMIAVTGLTQLVKWMGLPDGKGPLAVLGLAALGTALWAWSKGAISQATAFDLFSAWIVIALSAAGIFGFTRAAAVAVAGTKAPPSGAGASPTAKDSPLP